MRQAFATLALATLAVLGWVGPARADKVPIDQVPLAVRATIEREVGDGKLKDIDRETRHGRIVYEVEFERDGDKHEITVASDGTVLDRDD